MSQMHETGPNGVILLNLNWGYQVVKGGEVLVAIHDTVGGPHRTPACTDSARFHFTRLCRLYERLYEGHPVPTPRILHTLAGIIRQDKGHISNMNSANALLRRNVVAIKPERSVHALYFYQDWMPVYPEEK